jgi:hypothetical protein
VPVSPVHSNSASTMRLILGVGRTIHKVGTRAVLNSALATQSTAEPHH